MMKKYGYIFVLIAVLTAALSGMAGCATTVVGASGGSSGAGDKQTDTMTYTGAVVPRSEITISPKVSGIVKAVNADIGSRVQAGDVLCQVDDTDIKIQVRQAQAQYNAAVNTLNNVQNGTTLQSTAQLVAAIDKAKLDVSAAQTNLNQAQANYDAHIQVNQAKTALDAATAAYNAAQSMAANNPVVQAAQLAYQFALDAYNTTLGLFNQVPPAATQDDLNAALSALNTAQANLASAQAAAQTPVATAKSQMNAAQAAYDNAVLNEKNALNAAKSALEAAKLEQSTAEHVYSIAINVTNPGSVKSAQSAVDLAKAALDLAQRQLDNTSITAPVSGTISTRNVQEGMLISPATNLFTLVDLDTAFITLTVSQDDINSFTVGKAVSISVANTDIKDLPGEISVISPSANLQNGMFSVKITVDNPDGALRGGMFADVSVKK